jgi:4-hydroxy-tetrahydrodipicolinate synthase
MTSARGLWAPVVTPIDDDSQPDAARLVALGRWLLEEGCHGLGIFGTTSEANSFSVRQRMRLLEQAVAGGLDPDVLMPGTGMCAQDDSIELTRHAIGLGCTKVLMLPPFYYKGVPEEGLYRAFSEVIERVGGGFRLYLYHIPPVAQVPIPASLIERLQRAFPEVMAGVKDSSGDGEHILGLIRRFGDLEIFPGTETYLLDGMREGGPGCISATANVNPKAIRAVYDAFERGDSSVEELQARISATRAVIQKRPVIPALKAVIANATGDAGWRRTMPPLEPLDEGATAELKAELAAGGFELRIG